MAAAGKHVGRYLQRNSRVLLNNTEQWGSRRSFRCSAALQQHAALNDKDSAESIVIPRKKTWSKEAVLQALASIVKRDPTAYPYQFQDDPYLYPQTAKEFRTFSASQESGRAAAKYFVNIYPKFFTKDFAEPHIPCLMPETVTLRLDEVSEEALKERIGLRKVKAAVDVYDQLLQAGTTVSMETTHELLDLISLYNDREPVQEWGPSMEDTRQPVEGVRRKTERYHRVSEVVQMWQENNNAERIFNLLPERDTRCYSALIRGMVKHGAHAKAFSMYTDMLNNRISADVHIFNALISAAPDVKDKYAEKWEAVTELLNHMSQQKVQPNLLTFNAVLKVLRQCGFMGKSIALDTLNEMKTLAIVPSLASYGHFLAIFNKPSSVSQSDTNILQELMSEIEGSSFTCRDPDDVRFFSTAMMICLDRKDIELAYRVQSLVEAGENWRLLGDSVQQSIYYGRFFRLLCKMEHIDVVLQWYRRLVPSLYYPNPPSFLDLLQTLETDGRLDLLPAVWKDIRTVGHDNKQELVEEVLNLMVREKHGAEVQESFAECALDIKTALDSDRGSYLEWRGSSLSNVTSLLLRANKTQPAWEMLKLFKSKNRVPPEELMEDFLSACQREGAPQLAVELLELSAAFYLPGTRQLARRTLDEFTLTEEQRAKVTELESAGGSTD